MSYYCIPPKAVRTCHSLQRRPVLLRGSIGVNNNNMLSAYAPRILKADIIASAPVGAKEPSALFPMKNEWCSKVDAVEHYYSGFPTHPSDYGHDIATIVFAAREALKVAVEEFTKSGGVKPALMFDCDDTVWCTYYEAKQSGWCYNPKIWDEYKKELNFPCIDDVVNLIKYATHELGVTCIVITGRPEDELDNTVAGLAKCGLVRGVDYYEQLFLRHGSNTMTGTGESAAAYKTRVRKQIEDTLGFTFLMSIGDQWSDSGNYGGIAVKLPNPMYFLA